MRGLRQWVFLTASLLLVVFARPASSVELGCEECADGGGCEWDYCRYDGECAYCGYTCPDGTRCWWGSCGGELCF
jgi:hypothetical protein